MAVWCVETIVWFGVVWSVSVCRGERNWSGAGVGGRGDQVLSALCQRIERAQSQPKRNLGRPAAYPSPVSHRPFLVFHLATATGFGSDQAARRFHRGHL